VYLLKFFDHLAETKVTGHLGWWVEHRYLMSFIALPIGYQVGQFLGFPIWGRAVDRFGRKPVIFVSSTLHTISWFLWIFLSPAMLPWMAVVQMGGGLAGAGQDVGSFNMMLQYNRKGGSGYQALGSVLFAVAGFVAALLCGSLLDHLDFAQATLWENSRFQFHADKYTILILTAVVIKYIGDLFILPRVHDLASRPRRETVRYVFVNMYDALNATIFSPVAAGVGLTTRTLGQLAGKASGAAGDVRKWFK
jgi:MFS family permease